MRGRRVLLGCLLFAAGLALIVTLAALHAMDGLPRVAATALVVIGYWLVHDEIYRLHRAERYACATRIKGSIGAYRAQCNCGWRGSRVTSREEAIAEATAHAPWVVVLRDAWTPRSR